MFKLASADVFHHKEVYQPSQTPSAQYAIIVKADEPRILRSRQTDKSSYVLIYEYFAGHFFFGGVSQAD